MLTENAGPLIALAAAVSAFCTILLVTWPYLSPDPLKARMRQIGDEQERIRLRERSRLGAQGKPLALRSEPGKLFKAIADRLNLAKHADDGATALILRRAGYRGPGPVVTFLVARLVVPMAAFILAALYVFLVLQLDQPWVVKLGLALAVSCVGYYAPGLYVRNRTQKRQKSIRRAWPDALDLLLICVESGMSLESAMHKVAGEIGAQSVDLAEELSLTTAELSYLQDRRKAYENLGERTDLDGVKAVMTGLIQSEKYGTPVGNCLRVLAQENRDMRMSDAEKKAHALPPKLTVPMILFFLPVLFAVITTPAAIQIINLP
ncbi:type II secretion system F family protein [Inquilinus sp. OTU3971]|uniref:type II secretion system F family protein n=1 Tax=Inquilinus sp. OTU3971 TaxID=3043855 RepID=UPI00313AED0E